MKKFKEYALCVVGSIVVAVGIYFFKVPNNFSIGGISGLSIILGNYFHISSASTLMSIINIAMLAIGFIFCGKECGMKTAVGTLVFSGTVMLLEKLVPISGPLTDEPLVELVFAVFVPAAGSAVLFNVNGSTGGTDITAMILKKYARMDIGTGLLISDSLITLGSFLFGIKTGLLAILGLLGKTLIVNSVIESINLCKCFSIVTNNPEEINDYITKHLRRGTTVTEATGGFTNAATHVVMSVMNRSQALELRDFLRLNYPDSFIIITNSSEIIGKGFRGF